jgi:hypothetical protein
LESAKAVLVLIQQFIDPTVEIFVDPCNPDFSMPSGVEIKKFKQNTDR